RLSQVVLFELSHALAPATRLYGEGFQMLSQTGGSLEHPLDLGDYTDAKHYRMPQPAGAVSAYGLATLAPPSGPRHLLAFTSCRRFSGRLELDSSTLRVVMDTEGLELAPRESWELEEFTVSAGEDVEVLLAELAERLNHHHPRLATAQPPTGWCSWYCFGP